MKAVILFLGFCYLTLPGWAQATVTSFEDKSWLSPRPVGVFRSDRGAYRNPKMLLDFLRRKYPDVKIRRWVRPGTSREEDYQKDIEAYQNHIRTWPNDREGPSRLEAFRIRYGEVEDVRTLMSALVPDAVYQVDGKNLAAIGSAGSLAQIRELLQEIDRPLDDVWLDYSFVELSAEMQQKTGVVWRDPGVTESRMEYVLGTPLSKRPTTDPSRLRLGRFTGSSYVAPAEPSVVIPLVRGTIRMPPKAQTATVAKRMK